MFLRFTKSIRNIFKIEELRQRIAFTIMMVVIYRVAIHISIPGVNNELLRIFLLEQHRNLTIYADTFSGGAFSRLSILAFGIFPITIAFSLMNISTIIVPSLTKLKGKGELGKKKILYYTRWLIIGVGVVLGFIFSMGLENLNGGVFVQNPGWIFRVTTVMTLLAGTTLIFFLVVQITLRGIFPIVKGNDNKELQWKSAINLIFVSGILSQARPAVIEITKLYQSGSISLIIILMLPVVMIGVVATIIFFESGRRKIPVQYAKRVVGRKIYGGQSTHIPFKINSAGTGIIIFITIGFSFIKLLILFFPDSWGQALSKILAIGTVSYYTLYTLLIMLFCFFITAVNCNPVDLADNLKKYGGFIPGVRPGRKTSDYFYRVLTRITFVGAVFLVLVVIIPDIIAFHFKLQFIFGGTTLLLVTGVGMDIAQSIETHVLTWKHAGFIKNEELQGKGF